MMKSFVPKPTFFLAAAVIFALDGGNFVPGPRPICIPTDAILGARVPLRTGARLEAGGVLAVALPLAVFYKPMHETQKLSAVT